MSEMAFRWALTALTWVAAGVSWGSTLYLRRVLRLHREQTEKGRNE